MSLAAIRPEHKQAIACQAQTDWDKLPQAKRKLALAREQFIRPVLDKCSKGIKARPAIEHLLAQIASGEAATEHCELANQLGRKGKPPSMATIQRWLSDYQNHGVIGLVSGHKGRERKTYGWEARALYWYQKPSKLAMASIADLLIQEAFVDVTVDRVTRYLKSLPHDVREKRRMGSKLYADVHKPARVRDTECVPVGAIYQGDGHTIDVYLAHPMTGNPWRPELTIWIDVRSRYIVGWYMSVAESSYSTLFSLSHALVSHNHVPASLHIDNGSGFKSKMMHDESTGFYNRFDISVMFSIPGNPKGKGQVERWFRTLRDKFDKTFDAYCGHDMAPDAIKKLLADVKANKKQLPSLETYLAGLKEFIQFYNHRVHSALDGQSPANLWATLEPVPVHMTEQAIIRPRIERSIRRGSITLFNREYRHAELIPFNQQKVFVEYNLHDDSTVRVMTRDERLICDASLTQKTPYLSDSRLEDMNQKRLEGQIKRLERHADEKRAQSKMMIDHEDLARELDSDEPLQLEGDNAEPLIDFKDELESDVADINLNILDTRY